MTHHDVEEQRTGEHRNTSDLGRNLLFGALAIMLVLLGVGGYKYLSSRNNSTQQVGSMNNGDTNYGTNPGNGDGTNGGVNGNTNGTAAATSDCFQRGDKVGTWSEGNAPHRIEVGGHGPQHLDYYPRPGVKAVSYVIDPIPDPSGVPSVVFGYGSIWEWPVGCPIDGEADATHYAQARLDTGHSGIVVHDGKVVANVANLSQGEIDALVNNFVTNGTNNTSANAPAAAPADCKDGTREDHAPRVGQPWTPKGEFRTVNFWTNEKGHSQKERKLLLKPGENPHLKGGGASWSWPASCGTAVQSEFAKNPLPEVTLQQLKNEGLAS